MPNPIRKLAIVGASARAAAFSALRAGFDVVAADLFADADLARHAPVTRIDRYPEGFADWLAETECDAWMYTGALENYPDLVERMAELRPLAGNRGTALRDVRDPMKLQAACAAAGVPFPETRTSAEGLPFDGSWLCKTYRGASGSGVWRLDGRAALEPARSTGAVLQQYVEGVPAAAIFVIGCGQAHLAGVTQQIIRGDASGPWQYAGSFGPLRLGVEITRQIQAFGDSLANHRLIGLVGVDIVVDERAAWMIEVNPRYTSSIEIIERFSSSPLASAHIAACTDDVQRLRAATTNLMSLLTPGAMQYGKTILYARHDVRISQAAYQWMERQAETDFLRGCLADIPHAGEIIRAGRPIVTIFAEGVSAADFQSRLRDRVAEVEQPVYDA